MSRSSQAINIVSVVLTADTGTHSEHGLQPAPEGCMGFSYTEGQFKGNRTMCREGIPNRHAQMEFGGHT